MCDTIKKESVYVTKEKCYLQDSGYERFEAIVGMIGGKWKLRIIYMLAFHEVLRYGELKRLLVPVTHKMLTNQLKELEKDGLIIRKEYPHIRLLKSPWLTFNKVDTRTFLRLVVLSYKCFCSFHSGCCCQLTVFFLEESCFTFQCRT